MAGSSPRHNQPPRQLPRQIPAAGLPPHRQAAALPSCQTAFPSPDHAWIHALLLGFSHGGSSSPAPPCAPPPCRRQLPVASCRHPVEREAPHPHACSHTGGARGRLSKVWRMHSAAAARLPGATPPTHLKQAVRTCHSDCQCLLPPKPPELFGARRFLQARLPVCRLASPPHPANTARCRACSAAGCCREATLSRSAARGGPWAALLAAAEREERAANGGVQGAGRWPVAEATAGRVPLGPAGGWQATAGLCASGGGMGEGWGGRDTAPDDGASLPLRLMPTAPPAPLRTSMTRPGPLEPSQPGTAHRESAAPGSPALERAWECSAQAAAGPTTGSGGGAWTLEARTPTVGAERQRRRSAAACGSPGPPRAAAEEHAAACHAAGGSGAAAAAAAAQRPCSRGQPWQLPPLAPCAIVPPGLDTLCGLPPLAEEDWRRLRMRAPSWHASDVAAGRPPYWYTLVLVLVLLVLAVAAAPVGGRPVHRMASPLLPIFSLCSAPSPPPALPCRCIQPLLLLETRRTD